MTDDAPARREIVREWPEDDNAVAAMKNDGPEPLPRPLTQPLILPLTQRALDGDDCASRVDRPLAC